MSQINASSFLFSRTAGFYDHEIDQSLRFEDGDTAYLNRTPASASNRRTWTWSGWVKRGNLGTAQRIFSAGTSGSASGLVLIGFETSNALQMYVDTGSVNSRRITTQVFRDVGSWYHIVCTLDTTDATADNRMRVYVNGSEVTDFSTKTNPALNIQYGVNNTQPHYIGRYAFSASQYLDSYLAECCLVDGQALDPTSFGETKSGIWVPKDTSGLTFGTNGFRLAFADGAAIGDDTSGNTNDWTAYNLAASDVVLDSPTNNFGVMSSIDKGDGTATYSEGNLKVSVGDNEEAFGSFGMSSGKWYWEIRYVSSGASNNKIGLGIADTAAPNNNEVTNNGHQGTTYAPNDILAVAVDVDNELFSFYKNGTIIETDTDWSAKGWTSIKPIVTSSNSAGEEVCVLNFGQDDTFAGAISATGNTDGNGQGVFKYTPPSGFLALCSSNLPSGAIDTAADETPEEYFNTVLWSGNGSTQSITGVNFQSDLTWIKNRSSGSYNHHLVDAVRGVSLRLVPNGTQADGTSFITSFDSDGFSLNSNSTVNGSGFNYVGWNWKANGAGVANTDGTLSSTVSVGATSQQNWFSIVSFTGASTQGATVGHGLGVAPDMIIAKARNAAQNWWVYHSSLGYTKNISLNLTGASFTDINTWLAEPTSSLITIGDNFSSSNNYIAYCFANAEGLCRAGKYTGNGSTDGTFVYTGFRPAFLLIKETGNANSWELFDTARDPDNIASQRLFPNASQAEATTASLDIISNGFKFRVGNTGINRSSGNYIYLAIAEQPFKFANAR